MKKVLTRLEGHGRSLNKQKRYRSRYWRERHHKSVISSNYKLYAIPLKTQTGFCSYLDKLILWSRQKLIEPRNFWYKRMMNNKQEAPPNIKMLYTSCDMDEPWKRCAEGKKPVTRGRILYESLPNKGRERGICRERKMKEWVKGIVWATGML